MPLEMALRLQLLVHILLLLELKCSRLASWRQGVSAMIRWINSRRLRLLEANTGSRPFNQGAGAVRGVLTISNRGLWH